MIKMTHKFITPVDDDESNILDGSGKRSVIEDEFVFIQKKSIFAFIFIRYKYPLLSPKTMIELSIAVIAVIFDEIGI